MSAGDTVVYTPKGGLPTNLVGIFNHRYATTTFQNGVEVEGTASVILMATDDVPSAANGDSVTCDSVVYKVTGVDIQIQSGLSLLYLRKA